MAILVEDNFLSQKLIDSIATEIKTKDFTESPSLRTNNVFVCTQEITGTAFSDQTGKFVCPSTSGNNYVFILYDYDRNTIHARANPSLGETWFKAIFIILCICCNQMVSLLPGM